MDKIKSTVNKNYHSIACIAHEGLYRINHLMKCEKAYGISNHCFIQRHRFSKRTSQRWILNIIRTQDTLRRT